MSELKQSENQGDSLIAAIEGNRAGMSHADLVMTCDMLERGRALWMKECEEAKRERDQWKACASEMRKWMPTDSISALTASATFDKLLSRWLHMD